MNLKNQNRVAFYARVATENENGTGIKEQLKELKNYCKNAKAVEYSDVASGLSKNRPGLGKLLTDAKNKVFDTLYVIGFARLARDTELLERIMKKLESNKIKVITLTGENDTPVGYKIYRMGKKQG
jgi:DNA invertase Pin-like site-specific DNA recombinase